MQPVQRLVPQAVAEIVRRQPPSAGRTAFAWTMAVGPALDRATRIERRGGVLHVTPRDRRWAHELERASTTILSRLQTLLGSEIAEIRIEIE